MEINDLIRAPTREILRSMADYYTARHSMYRMGNATDNIDYYHNTAADLHTNLFVFHNSRSRRIDLYRDRSVDLCPASRVSCMSDSGDLVYGDGFYALRRPELQSTTPRVATLARKFFSM